MNGVGLTVVLLFFEGFDFDVSIEELLFFFFLLLLSLLSCLRRLRRRLRPGSVNVALKGLDAVGILWW